MLHIIGGPGALRPEEAPELSPVASHLGSEMWCQALNKMFSVLSDFAVSRTARDDLPYKHMQAILTMEQLVRQTASGSVAHRDTDARHVLMFTALDTVERLTAMGARKTSQPSPRVFRPGSARRTDFVRSGRALASDHRTFGPVST